MKILILDFLFPDNHAALYNQIIQSLSKLGKIEVISKKGFYNDFFNKWENVELKEFSINKKADSMLTRKLQSVISIIKTNRLINKKEKYSLKLVLTFDTVAFGFAIIFSQLKNTYLLHHKNIDELENKKKRIFFKSYMNKVNHIVFEEYFKEYLVREVGVSSNRVFVIPHPSLSNEPLANEEFRFDCVGLSNSNDEEFIKAIIDQEIENGYLKNTKTKVILRSKKYKYDNGFLKIISGFMPKEEYDDYLKKCKMVFIPLPKNFKYRVSGVMFDAFANNKMVLANNVEIIKNYQEKYPSICIGVENEKEFFSKVNDCKSLQISKKNFEKFKSNHNASALLDSFNKIIECVDMK